MARYSNTVTNDAGNPLALAVVTVRLAGTETLATLTDDFGAALSNPLPATGLDGAFAFNATAGYYELYIVVNGHARSPLFVAVGNAASEGCVFAHHFRIPGDTTDTNAIKRAWQTGFPVRCVAGMGLDTDGAYLMNPDASDAIPSGVHIFGDGIGKTILRSPSGGFFVFYTNSGSANPANNVTDLHFSDMTLEGRVVADGFQEGINLVLFSGVTNVIFERIKFKGFRSDGIGLYSGDALGDERHNFDIRVRDCIFDGVNSQNRNGISIIDVTGLVIEGCVFRNCSRSNEPGAIDFEPNADAFAVIKDAVVTNCRFENVGGNVGQIAVQLPDVCPAPIGITVTNCTFVSYAGTGTDFWFQHTHLLANVLDTADPDNQVIFTGNRGTGGNSPFQIYTARGVLIEGNTFSDYTNAASIASADEAPGAGARSFKVISGKIVNNRFLRIGSGGKIGLNIYATSVLEISGNEFIDCGSGAAGSCAIDFVAGTSDNVAIEGNDFSAPTGKTLVAIQKEAGHTFTSATNRFGKRNRLNSLASSFVATSPGEELTGSAAYDPGSLADGVGSTTTVAVTNAALGDYASATFSLDLQGISVTAWVSSANTVSVRFQNESGGTLDLASGTLRAMVRKV